MYTTWTQHENGTATLTTACYYHQWPTPAAAPRIDPSSLIPAFPPSSASPFSRSPSSTEVEHPSASTSLSLFSPCSTTLSSSMSTTGAYEMPPTRTRNAPRRSPSYIQRQLQQASSASSSSSSSGSRRLGSSPASRDIQATPSSAVSNRAVLSPLVSRRVWIRVKRVC